MNEWAYRIASWVTRYYCTHTVRMEGVGLLHRYYCTVGVGLIIEDGRGGLTYHTCTISCGVWD